MPSDAAAARTATDPGPGPGPASAHGAEPGRRPLWQLPLDLVRGFVIGVAELVPGVSGGTIALVTGVYEQLIDSLHHVSAAVRRLVTGPDRRDGASAELRRAEWRLVAPLLLGMVAAALTVAGPMEAFVSGSPELARGLFLGLVLCSIAVPLRMLPPSGRPVWVDALLVLAAAGTTYGLVGLAGAGGSGGGEGEVALPWVFLAATVAICALVLPGVSGSFFLLVVGLYSATLAAVDARDVAYLATFAVGAVVGLGTFVPLLRHLLIHRRRTTLLVMAGLLLGSLRALWPWQSSPDGAAGEAQGPGALLAPYDPVLAPVLLAVLGAAVVAVLMVVESHTGSRAAADDTGPTGPTG